MPVLADLINTNVATAGSINDKLIAYFSGIYRGSGSPEGVVDAPLGSTYQDVTTPGYYIKTTATGTLTGWAAIAFAGGAAPISSTTDITARSGTATAVKIGNAGPGSLSGISFQNGEVFLYRPSALAIRASVEFQSDANIRAREGVASFVRIGSDGVNASITFGSAVDTNAYRGAANVLQTDDGLNLNSGPLAGASAPGPTIYGGTGAPNNANGNNGDEYHRVDGGALTTIYQRRAGAWVGIV